MGKCRDDNDCQSGVCVGGRCSSLSDAQGRASAFLLVFLLAVFATCGFLAWLFIRLQRQARSSKSRYLKATKRDAVSETERRKELLRETTDLIGEAGLALSTPTLRGDQPQLIVQCMARFETLVALGANQLFSGEANAKRALDAVVRCVPILRRLLVVSERVPAERLRADAEEFERLFEEAMTRLDYQGGLELQGAVGGDCSTPPSV